MAARIGIGLVALVVLAWLAVGLRNARLEADGADAVGRSPSTASPARLADARDAYSRARKLNADSTPEVREAGLANFDGRPREAVRLLRDVVRREPENFDAWFLMASVSARIDPSLAADAEERARALNPLQFRRLG